MKANPRWWIVGLVFGLMLLAVFLLSVLVTIILGINVAWWLPEILPQPTVSGPRVEISQVIQPTQSPSSTAITPTDAPAITPPLPTKAPTRSPTGPTREPSTLGTPNPWLLIFETRFSGPDSLTGGWASLPADQVSFITYRNRPAMRVDFEDIIFIESQIIDNQEAQTMADSQIEVSLALQDNASAAVELRCRGRGETDGYTLRLSRERWLLLRQTAEAEVILDSGAPATAFAEGGWGTYRLGCAGSSLFVWDDSGVISEVKDETYTTGQSWLVLIPEARAARSQVLLGWQRVFAR